MSDFRTKELHKDFIAALFLTAKTWKPPRYYSVDEINSVAQ